ncbi:hypothetical protein HF324_25690 [Chitinophaga oryzae]|uniref:Uncharacterized protein n=1 Tax=Chitinophaga oryzae TaxID=2725414 RepID=A0ABX6LM96_9BACT|nr:hypothetical protein [Chitinophaga oryzae]QJB41051.1 hypothetical protein HF324_25690 [Chitinophaga oryzae]
MEHLSNHFHSVFKSTAEEAGYDVYGTLTTHPVELKTFENQSHHLISVQMIKREIVDGFLNPPERKLFYIRENSGAFEIGAMKGGQFVKSELAFDNWLKDVVMMAYKEGVEKKRRME